MKSTTSFLLLIASLFIARGNPTLTIEAGQATGKASPILYGLMTEEISHSYDGGLYAELVHNRAFLDSRTEPVHWSVVAEKPSEASMALDPANPLNEQLKTSLKVQVASATADAPAGVANDGYWGIPLKPHTRYRASFYAKAAEGFSGPVRVALVGEDQRTVYAEAKSSKLGADWKRYEMTLKTGEVQPTSGVRLLLSLDRPGTVWLDLVSLFPPTWNHRPNGLRPDIMQMLVDMKPAFLRLPGGNYLEGDTIETRFDWKKTIGPLAERPGHQGPWGYRSTDGLGLLEFLEWCEDMKAEPVLAVYAGYSLHGQHINPGADLEPFVRDALDEIEYVTGSKSTKWGARRAKDGHPRPFPLHYVEIGNEDWFDRSGSYDARFVQFSQAIHVKYPGLKCISTVGTEQPEEKRVHSIVPDVLDEHYYRNADTVLKDSPTRFEKYSRSGPEIFVGEWAAHETTFPPWDERSRNLARTPNMKAALADAAWMAAMERNSDLIKMQCYAPLFVNVNPGASQWRPNMLGYDAMRVFGSPSYYAFRTFSQDVGDEILKASFDSGPVQYSVTKNSRTKSILIKLVNPEPTPQTIDIRLNGVGALKPEGTATAMSAPEEATNSIDHPADVVPVKSKLTNVSPQFSYTVPASGIVVLTVGLR